MYYKTTMEWQITMTESKVKHPLLLAKPLHTYIGIYPSIEFCGLFDRHRYYFYSYNHKSFAVLLFLLIKHGMAWHNQRVNSRVKFLLAVAAIAYRIACRIIIRITHTTNNTIRKLSNLQPFHSLFLLLL